jgi:pilus assembly protein Flp/PilA
MGVAAAQAWLVTPIGFSSKRCRQMIYQETYPMRNYREVLRNLLREDSGQDLIEYALVAGLIGLGAVTAFNGLSSAIGTAFGNIGTELTNAT